MIAWRIPRFARGQAKTANLGIRYTLSLQNRIHRDLS